jgi:hypothetical protein
MTKPQPQQPWAVLYNLESKIGQKPLAAVRKVGRPASPIPRKEKMINLTDEEIRILESITGLIQQRFAPAKVHRGQVAGFALRYLMTSINALGGLEDVTTWTEMVNKLARKEK